MLAVVSLSAARLRSSSSVWSSPAQRIVFVVVLPPVSLPFPGPSIQGNCTEEARKRTRERRGPRHEHFITYRILCTTNHNSHRHYYYTRRERERARERETKLQNGYSRALHCAATRHRHSREREHAHTPSKKKRGGRQLNERGR